MRYSELTNEEATSNIDSVAKDLSFLPTRKKELRYSFVNGGEQGKMPPMTYTKLGSDQTVVTHTKDGKETQKAAKAGDIMMSGPSRENYAIDAAKFPKLYQGNLGDAVIPEQHPRMVATYDGEPITFTAPWGESMVLKPGDYLVKDGDAGYYRIAKVEYEATYNQPGK